MAESKKTAGKTATAPATATEGDVVEEIKSQNIVRADNVTAALESIKKEKDAKQQREIKYMINLTEYDNKKKRLDLRKNRAIEKIKKDALTKSKEILDDLCGQKATVVETKEKRKEAKKEYNEALRNVDKEYDRYYRELRDLYPGYWSYEWDLN